MRAIVAMSLAGCYHPSPAHDVPCSTDFHCPGAQLCDRNASPPTCVDVLGDASADGAGRDAADGPMPDAPSTMPPGAVLWLPFDTMPPPIPDAAGTHAFNCAGTCPGTTTGVHGGAYVFSGQALRAPSRNDLQGTAGFTLAVWARLDAVPPAMYADVACKLTLTDAAFCLGFAPGSGKPDFYLGGVEGIAPTAPQLGSWHHYLMTWAAGTRKAYIDGALVLTTAIASVPSDNSDFVVGANVIPSMYPFVGALDDVVMYDRVLTQVEIAQLARP